MKRIDYPLLAGIFTALTLFFVGSLLSGCAGTPKETARAEAVIQKTSVDGIGNAYLEYCQIVRKPACVDADRAASERGEPQTKQQRIDCLQPCDSATAERVTTGVDVVRTAQTALFHLLSGDPTDAELEASRAQLRRAASQLILLLEEAGIMEILGDTLEGR